MNKKICSFDSMQALEKAKLVLNEDGIDYLIKLHRDSSFPGVFEMQNGVASLFVDENYDKKYLLNILDKSGIEYLEAESIDIQMEDDDSEEQHLESISKRKFNLLLLISIVVFAVLGYRWFVLEKRLLSMEDNPVFKSSWSYDASVYKQLWKENNKVASEVVDNDFNGVFEFQRIMDKNGNLTTEFKDIDEDGVFEMQLARSKDGLSLTYYFDRDEDCYFDSIVEINEEGLILEQIDIDFDGNFDRISLKDQEMNLLRSVDADGLIDIIKEVQ